MQLKTLRHMCDKADDLVISIVPYSEEQGFFVVVGEPIGDGKYRDYVLRTQRDEVRIFRTMNHVYSVLRPIQEEFMYEVNICPVSNDYRDLYS